MLKKIFFLIIFCAFILLPPVWSRLKDLAVILQSLDIQIIINYIHSFGNFAPLISFVLMTFCIITPFPSFLITFANAALYGWINGAIISWSGAMFGALLCFLFARYFGREAVEKFIPQQALKKADSFFIAHGKYAVFIARLLPFLSFSLVSYGAGLTSITTASYLIATGLGQLPATIIYSYVGKMFTIDVYHLIFALLCLFLFSLTVYFVKKYYMLRTQKRCSTNCSSSLPSAKKKL